MDELIKISFLINEFTKPDIIKKRKVKKRCPCEKRPFGLDKIWPGTVEKFG